MTPRHWVLLSVFAGLGLTYVCLFTEWLRLAPIEIASQVRVTLQPPRFGRPVKKPEPAGKPTPTTNRVAPQIDYERIGAPEKGAINQTAGGFANVTFSLDGWYELTSLRVEDVPADGTRPRVLWQSAGKSRPLNSLLYGRDPEGMKPVRPGASAEPLKAGVPYRLIVEAGRRRGINNFKTTELAP